MNAFNDYQEDTKKLDAVFVYDQSEGRSVEKRGDIM